MKSTINVLADQPNFHIYWRNLMVANNAMGFAPELVQIIDELVANATPGDKAIFIELMRVDDVEGSQAETAEERP